MERCKNTSEVFDHGALHCKDYISCREKQNYWTVFESVVQYCPVLLCPIFLIKKTVDSVIVNKSSLYFISTLLPSMFL